MTGNRFSAAFSVTSAAFSPDGTRIVTGSTDHHARVWNAETFKLLAQIKGHGATVSTVAITPKRNRIVTSSYDDTARVWEVFPTGQLLIDEAKMLVPRCLTDAQRTLYHLAAGPPSCCKKMRKWRDDAGGETTGNADKSAPGPEIPFVDPTVGGVRVDQCLHDAEKCGDPAATEFCRLKGFTRATYLETETYKPTMILLDGHKCEGKRGCDAFSKITCQ
jgi:hypothetical protein